MNVRYLALRGFPVAVPLSLLVGCASVTRVTARHDPLYRAEAHASTITATAFNAEKKISQIRIDVVAGEMTACSESGGFPSVVPCRTSATFQAKICPFPAKPASATCTFTMQLGDRRLVTYTPSARTGSGSVTTGQTITYAAGASITQATMGSGTIPWDAARPVWWHTETPSVPSVAPDRIHVGFYPDPDIATYRAFTDFLQPLLLGAYFDTATAFSKDYSFWQNIFDLWAGPPGADASMGSSSGDICTWVFNGFAGNVTAITNGQTILHTTNFRDCGNISLGGTGTVFTGESSTSLRYIHESGHFLQGLGDEYCCNGGYQTVATPPNVHASEADCQTTATSIGVATSLCVQIGTTGRWRIDDTTPEIMDDDHNVTSGWRDASGRAVGNRAKACFNGNCY